MRTNLQIDFSNHQCADELKNHLSKIMEKCLPFSTTYTLSNSSDDVVPIKVEEKKEDDDEKKMVDGLIQNMHGYVMHRASLSLVIESRRMKDDELVKKQIV